MKGFLTELPRALKELEDQQQASSENLKLEVPLDPQAFYEDFGFIRHQRTGEAVPRLTTYQYDLWKLRLMGYKYRLAIKSQKCGVTTSSLLEDIQIALTTCKGKEILIIAQSVKTAFEHLRTLKYMMAMSTKYSRYLMQQSELIFKEEKTKMGIVYIRNPDNPKVPTRIIALGPSESSVWSWKSVGHIHMSDVAATNQIDDSGMFAVAFSRLANTGGTMLIETPPKGQSGTVYQLYKQAKLEENDPEKSVGRFKVMEIPAREAVAAGLMTQEFLDDARARDGVQYAEKYECSFLSAANTWYMPEMFKPSDDVIGL